MTFNWKKTLIAAFDVAIAVYLLLAVSAFNTPAEKATVCSEVKIDINNEMTDGFINASEVKKLLERNHLYPLAKPMADISARHIEEVLRRSPFVEQAECYKTQSGHVCITIRQRMPILHVMAANGENYYLDTYGSILPESRYASDMIVATGTITRPYAQKALTGLGNELLKDKFWQNQVVQVNVLADGTVEMVPRVGDHIIYLGPPANIGKKLERLHKFYLYGLNEAGWNKYAYISVEFDNQIICKKK
ncbi:MAG: cell division protein FtsQ [Prevotella sp.]|nr:cell division protein FtsQ [Prevotella sp.]